MLSFSEQDDIHNDDFNVTDNFEDEVSDVARLATLHEEDAIDEDDPVDGFEGDPGYSEDL